MSVTEVVGCKSFLDEKQGIALKISVVLPFIYIQVFSAPGVLVLMVLFTAPTSKDCLNKKKRRENLLINLQLQEP